MIDCEGTSPHFASFTSKPSRWQSRTRASVLRISTFLFRWSLSQSSRYWNQTYRRVIVHFFICLTTTVNAHGAVVNPNGRTMYMYLVSPTWKHRNFWSGCFIGIWWYASERSNESWPTCPDGELVWLLPTCPSRTFSALENSLRVDRSMTKRQPPERLGTRNTLEKNPVSVCCHDPCTLFF